jgi:hypothetical protein
VKDSPTRNPLGDIGTKAEASKFRSYVRYYLSDHRPLWAQLRL